MSPNIILLGAPLSHCLRPNNIAIVMATPSDYSTIDTPHKCIKECVMHLSKKTLQFFDMGLLSKALEILLGQSQRNKMALFYVREECTH